MKKRAFLGVLVTMILSMGTTAFAAPAAAFGDSSDGNHPMAPYAKSDIIVPRPGTSKYAALGRYQFVGVPTDVKGHWAEKYITYFLQTGIMKADNGKFSPNTPITYADFANTVARLGLEPVEFNGGSISNKVFTDYALWNPSHPTSQAGYICGEAGVWGNPSEANDTMIGYPGFRLGDTAQRQYIAAFLVNMLDPMAVSLDTQKYFSDMSQFSSALGRTSMERLVQEGIISGFADGTIRPNANVTKAELAVMLYKVLERSNFDMDKVSEHLYGNYHSYYWEEEGKLLNLVNEARRKDGVNTLKYDADLNALCEIKMIEKSIYGMDTFSQLIQVDGKTVAAGHVSQFYGRCTDMAKTFGLSNYRVGENAVTLASNAAKAHNHLTNSEGHRENYLSSTYEVAGFAVGPRATYQMFAYLK